MTFSMIVLDNWSKYGYFRIKVEAANIALAGSVHHIFSYQCFKCVVNMVQ